MAHPLFSFLRSFFHRISRMNRRHSCLSDYLRIFADIWPLANGWRPKYSLIVFVTQISQMTQIFFIGEFYSSDDTEFIRSFLAEAITHGFSQKRPIRSVQIPPESGICPTKKNLRKSVKSVGQKTSTKKNLCNL